MPKFWRISPREHFQENNVDQKKGSFVFFKFWAINAGMLLKNFWLPSLNWKLHIQGIKFYHISWCSMTHFVSFRLLAGIFRRVYRNCFLRALRIVLTEEKLFRAKKCFKWVSELERKRFRFSAKKSARTPNFCSISPKEHFFKKTMLERRNILLPFSDSERKTLGSCQKILAAFSKLKNTYPGDKILSHFLMFDDPFCQFPSFSRDIWRVYRNCFLRSLRIVLTEEKFFRTKKCFFNDYWS